MNGTQLLDVLPVAVYIADTQGRITYYNEAAADLWGHRPELGSDKWCGSWRLYWPDGRPLPHDECPMAMTLKEGRPIRGVEAIAEKPDGTRVRFLPYPTPLQDAAGNPIGAINLLMDVTERHQAFADSMRLAAIVASSDDAIISKTLTGEVSSWNAGAERIFGYEAHEMVGQPIMRIIPPELGDEEAQILARLRRGERIDHYETVRVAKDGRRVDISLSVSPLRDKSGNVVGASKIARDITERKQAEKMQRLLMDELTHRVKNTLTSIQAMASQSLAHAKSPIDFVSSFGGRMQALARAHDLLTRTRLQGAKVLEIVRDQVVLGADDTRVSYSGPVVVLDEQTSLHLALILHELATNARKYGALSSPNGHLSVQWELQTNHDRNLVIEWCESGGPKVNAPKERGFGSRLIDHMLRAHCGEISTRYGAGGIVSRIALKVLEPPRHGIGLPLAASNNDKTSPLLSNLEKERSFKGKRIIVIEDEPLVAMDMESILTAAQCEVTGLAANPDQARSLIGSAECDAALLDVNLCGHRVDDFAAALTLKRVPFAFVTGYGRESLPPGFSEAILLKKPFSREQLLAVVELLLCQTELDNTGSVVSFRPKSA